MSKSIIVCLALISCSVSHAALQTNFAASYGKYQNCALVMGTSKCFKLYFDPEGIVAGQVTAFLDLTNTLDTPRLNGDRILGDLHPAYTAAILQTTVNISIGRERTESIISFAALDPLNPPTNQILMFSYETGDLKPELAETGSFGGFFFQPGDFIDTYDPQTGVSMHYDHTQLQGVMFPFLVPEPSAGLLAVGLAAAVGVARRRRS